MNLNLTACDKIRMSTSEEEEFSNKSVSEEEEEEEEEEEVVAKPMSKISLADFKKPKKEKEKETIIKIPSAKNKIELGQKKPSIGLDILKSIGKESREAPKIKLPAEKKKEKSEKPEKKSGNDKEIAKMFIDSQKQTIERITQLVENIVKDINETSKINTDRLVKMYEIAFKSLPNQNQNINEQEIISKFVALIDEKHKDVKIYSEEKVYTSLNAFILNEEEIQE